MKNFIPGIILSSLILLTIFAEAAHSQSLRIVTVNTFTGTLTGGALGGSVLLLQDHRDENGDMDIDWQPLRFGVGAGTLMGLGTGFYDLYQKTGDSDFYIDGLINSAGSTGTIILLDTFYGMVTGAIVGSAISLMTKDHIINKGLRYGVGIGAWCGFAFGLIDAFAISSTQHYDDFYDGFGLNHGLQTSGFIQIHGRSNNYALGLINPVIINEIKVTNDGFLNSRSKPGIEFARLNIAL